MMPLKLPLNMPGLKLLSCQKRILTTSTKLTRGNPSGTLIGKVLLFESELATKT